VKLRRIGRSNRQRWNNLDRSLSTLSPNFGSRISISKDSDSDFTEEQDSQT